MTCDANSIREKNIIFLRSIANQAPNVGISPSNIIWSQYPSVQRNHDIQERFDQFIEMLVLWLGSAVCIIKDQENRIKMLEADKEALVAENERLLSEKQRRVEDKDIRQQSMHEPQEP